MGEVAAVVLDLDGVLVDSEARWDAAREALTREAGGTWRDDAQRAMMGMSSPEWSAYMRDELGVPMEAEAISRDPNMSAIQGEKIGHRIVRKSHSPSAASAAVAAERNTVDSSMVKIAAANET